MTSIKQEKINKNEAYKILRKSQREGDIPCQNSLEQKISERFVDVSIGRLVWQVQAYANNDDQSLELQRRCRAVNLSFFFDFGEKVQFRKKIITGEE